jgi:hypothetical protein
MDYRGAEGDTLQCDMFAKRVEGRVARQRQYCYSRRALIVGAAVDGWLERELCSAEC